MCIRFYWFDYLVPLSIDCRVVLGTLLSLPVLIAYYAVLEVV